VSYEDNLHSVLNLSDLVDLAIRLTTASGSGRRR
jgi:hypothetical protein